MRSAGRSISSGISSAPINSPLGCLNCTCTTSISPGRLLKALSAPEGTSVVLASSPADAFRARSLQIRARKEFFGAVDPHFATGFTFIFLCIRFNTFSIGAAKKAKARIVETGVAAMNGLGDARERHRLMKPHDEFLSGENK
jgi:hypothetical protein